MKPILSSLVAVAVATLATVGSAAPVLSPETPAGPVTATAAPWAQNLQGVAPAENGFVAAWLDARRSYDAGQTSATSLFTSAIASDGSIAEPFNTKIADGVHAAVVASVGSDPLVIYSDRDGMWRQRLGNDGHASGPRAQMTGVGYLPVGIATNGSDFLLATITEANRITVFRLSAAGDVTKTLDFADAVSADVSVQAVGADYHVVFRSTVCTGVNPCSYAIVERVIAPDDRDSFRELVGSFSRPPHVFTGSSGDRLIVGWNDDRTSQLGGTEAVYFIIFASNGIGSAPKQVATVPANTVASGARGSIGWDGRNFLLAWEHPVEGNPSAPFTVEGVRIAPDGTVLDPSAVALGTGRGAAPKFARGSGKTAVLWSDTASASSPSDVLGRVVDSFDSIGDTRGKFTVARSARLQRDPAVAKLSGGLLTVWRENDDAKTIAGSFRAAGEPAIALTFASGSPVTNSAPAVAVAEGIALVAWVSTGSGGSTVFARRVSPNGTPYYENAIEIGREAVGGLGDPSVAVASDGHQFLVVWAVGQQVQARRIAPDGTPLDPSPIVVSRQSSARFGIRTNVNAVWSGSRWLVQWFEDPTNPLILAPPLPPTTNVYTARIASDGTVIDASESPLLYTGSGVPMDLASAVSGDRVLVAWLQRGESGTCVEATTLHADGSAVSFSPIAVSCTDASAATVYGPAPRIAAAAAANGFTIAWSDAPASVARIVGARVTTDLRPSDAAPWLVSPEGRAAYAPALTPDGAVVAYARIADEPEYGGVARIFMRTLSDAATSRRRAVGR